MTKPIKTIACHAAGLIYVLAVMLIAPARAQGDVEGQTEPERQLEQRNKERRDEEREKGKRDPAVPLYAPGGSSRSSQPAPWNSTAPRSGSGSVPWNAP